MRRQLLRDSKEELAPLILSFQFPDVAFFTVAETTLAEMGYELFRDKRLSLNGEISCASCHMPEHSFSDPRPVSFGLSHGHRNAPPTINLFAANWLFWDGRADSLEMQAMEPLESPGEHGISRWQLASLLYFNYRGLYEANFGEFPRALLELLEQAPETIDGAIPERQQAAIPEQLYELWQQYHLDQEPVNPKWLQNYQALSEEQKSALDQVFVNGLRAIAQYQKGLLTRDSAFDRFIKRVEKQGVSAALNGEFGKRELRGFQLFTGKAACVRCHSGPFFSDGNFYNTGIARGSRKTLGRMEGLLRWKHHPYACQNPNPEPRVYCDEKEQAALLEESRLRKEIGRIKTPTLRNVALTAPYMSDGSFAELSEVLEAYNNPLPRSLGHVDPRIQPLGLSADEINDIIAFLYSLSSKVEDLSIY